MDHTSIFDIVTHPLNVAHAEDRKAETLLKRDPTNYQDAIECHQRAHCLLRTVQLNMHCRNVNLEKLTDAEKAIITSLYAQLEKHMTQQSILLYRQRKAIIDLKSQPYMASMVDQAAQLVVVDAFTHKEKLERQLSEHDLLLESLKEKINQEEKINKASESQVSREDEGKNQQVRMSELEERNEGNNATGQRKDNSENMEEPEKASNMHVVVDRVITHGEILNKLAETNEEPEVLPVDIGEGSVSTSFGGNKVKSLQQTFEEISNVNEQFKLLVDNLVGENLCLKEELEAQHQYIIQQRLSTVKDRSLDAGDMTESGMSGESPIYSLAKAMDISPLAQVNFEVPDEELRRLNTADVVQTASPPARKSMLMKMVERSND